MYTKISFGEIIEYNGDDTSTFVAVYLDPETRKVGSYLGRQGETPYDEWNRQSIRLLTFTSHVGESVREWLSDNEQLDTIHDICLHWDDGYDDSWESIQGCVQELQCRFHEDGDPTFAPRYYTDPQEFFSGVSESERFDYIKMSRVVAYRLLTDEAADCDISVSVYDVDCMLDTWTEEVGS